MNLLAATLMLRISVASTCPILLRKRIVYKSYVLCVVTALIIVLLDKSIQLDSAVGWVKANAGQTGFYRVNYDMSDWMQFITMLHDHHTVRTVFIVCM